MSFILALVALAFASMALILMMAGHKDPGDKDVRAVGTILGFVLMLIGLGVAYAAGALA